MNKPKNPLMGAQSAGDRMAAQSTRRTQVARRQCKDPALRAELESDSPRWLKTIFPRRFSLPWAPYHLDIIYDSEYAIDHGTNQLHIAPRGGGKSRPVMGVVLKSVLTRRSPFPVYAPWDSDGVDAAFRFWLGALCNNTLLADLYPEFCDPFRAGKMVSQKMLSLTWEDTGENTGARTAVSDGLIIMPDSLGIIGSTTINGNPLGMAYDAPDGQTIRPTTIFLDDPQDDKPLDVSTPIATPGGFKPMGQICVGDTVFNETGKPCMVLGVTPVMPGRPCYRVGFDDGSEIVCDGVHPWMTSTALQRTNQRRKVIVPDPSRATRPQCQAQPFCSMRTTNEIASTLRAEGGRINHSIPLTAPLEIPDSKLIIPPYLLGVWLGDGCRRSGRICGMDREIFERIKELGFVLGKEGVLPNNRAVAFTVKGLRGLLKRVGVFHCKHIPEEYLWSGETQRMELLRGLMDTDGNITKPYPGKGQTCSFCNTNKALVDGVVFLCRSLGIKATTKAHPGGSMKYRGKTVRTAEYWVVRFVTRLPVFFLPRKLNLIPKTGKPNVLRRYIVSVTPTKSVPVRCIKVDSPSSLFLCGEGLIPTHNTAKSPVLVEKTVRKINADFAGMGGPDKTISMLMCATIKRKGCVTDHFRTSPEWHVKLTPRVLQWPDTWDEEDSPVRALWNEWADVKRGGDEKKDEGADALRFYAENREAMTKGMRVSWDHRFDAKKGQPDALYSAMVDYYRIGHIAFMSEQQGDPVSDTPEAEYKLTAEAIRKQIGPLLRGQIPEDAAATVAFVDLNYHAAAWGVVAASNVPCYSVVDYGWWTPGRGLPVWQEKGAKQALEIAIYHACESVVDMLLARPYGKALTAIVIDCGSKWASTVHAACRQLMARRSPPPIYAAKGFATAQYREPFRRQMIKRRGCGADIRYMALDREQMMHWDSHVWHMITQRGWLIPIGLPGSVCLFNAGGKTTHAQFAEEAAADVLEGMQEKNGKAAAVWRTTGRNEAGDVLAGCGALLSTEGIRPDAADDSKQARRKAKAARKEEVKAEKAGNKTAAEPAKGEAATEPGKPGAPGVPGVTRPAASTRAAQRPYRAPWALGY